MSFFVVLGLALLAAAAEGQPTTPETALQAPDTAPAPAPAADAAPSPAADAAPSPAADAAPPSAADAAPPPAADSSAPSPAADAAPSPAADEAPAPDSPPGREAVSGDPPAADAAAPRLTRRPELLEAAEPQYPPEAWAQDIEGDVVLLLWVDEQGEVEAAEVVSTPGHGMELAALVAAKKLRFSPAEVDGRPAKLRIRYTFHFRKPEKGAAAQPPPPPAAAPCPQDPRPPGRLTGQVLERGTRSVLAGAQLYLLDLDRVVLTDAAGRFSEELPPGGYAITLAAPGHHRLDVLERVEPGQQVEVRYYLERDRHGAYRSIVWGTRGRSVVGRTSLADAEIYEVPGTFGDPFRVVMLLPGVATPTSGLSYPVVRGALPGDTRYEVDGVQVPLLYHLLFGTSVVNPRLTTGITFEPGGYSVEHGGVPGALIQARAAPPPEERRTAADVSLVQASLYHAQPITENLQAQVAARYGTLGLIIEALAANTVLRFWDYQAKLDWQAGRRDELELLTFGAGNAAGETKLDGREEVLTLGFHRGLLRWRHGVGAGWLTVELEGGQEAFLPPGDEKPAEPGMGGAGETEPPRQEGPPSDDGGDEGAEYRYTALRLELSQRLHDDLELRSGVEAYLQDFGFGAQLEGAHVADDGLTAGAWLEAEWSPGRWTIVPGVRVDHYRYGLEQGERKSSLDPRLSLARELGDRFTAKASVGMHHGPPRVTLVEGPLVVGPVPGMMGIGLDHGLSRSVQLAAGLEAKLPWRLEATLQGYHAWLHTGLDFSLMNVELESRCATIGCGGGDDSPQPIEGDEDEADAPPPATDGRAYGLELLLRRRLGESVYGWLSYSLSRSERDVPGHGTLPFAFDQRHVVNAVVSWEVGRHWTLGASWHLHSGRPYTPERLVRCSFPDGIGWDEHTCPAKPFSARLPAFWRLDLRLQKRELFDTWYFDFYVDVVNATFNKEVVDYSLNYDGKQRPEEVPIFIPMIGIRGQI